jgi:(p)ppGpp synthase/HD superfamily hydrolase
MRVTGRLKFAVAVAKIAHKGQLDKSGYLYIDHPLRVMEALEPYGETAMITGVLHDVVEDTELTLDLIRDKFGQEIADIVDSVSQRQNEPYLDFVRRSNENPIGRLVKIADIHDNMLPSRMAGRSPGAEEKYMKALDILDSPAKGKPEVKLGPSPNSVR